MPRNVPGSVPKAARARRLVIVSLAALLAALTARSGWHWYCRARSGRFLAECRAARDSRNWNVLDDTAQRWSEWEPRRAEAWLFRAEAAQARGSFVLAADFLGRIDPQDPKALPALVARAKLLLGPANRPLDGVTICEQILHRDSRVTDAHQWLIQFFALTLQRERLIDQMHAAVRAEREPPEAYVFLFLIDTLRLSNGVEMNTRWLEVYPDQELFLVAQALQSGDETAPAAEAGGNDLDLAPRPEPKREELLGELLRRFPQNLELLSHHIERAIAEGDVDRAIDLLSQAPAAADRDNRFWRYRGWVRVSQGDLDGGQHDYRHAIELNPLDWPTRNRLVALLRLKQEFDEAKHHIEIVERATRLRGRLRKLPSAEMVTPEILEEMGLYAEMCGDRAVPAAIRKIIEQRERAK